FGIATLVLVFAEIITETGVNTFLIQNKEKTYKYIDTSWLVSILRGVIIFSLILFSATFISLFFKNPDSKNLLILISFVPLLRGFINPSIIKFQKELTFHKEFYFRTSCFLVETFFSIFLVLITKKTEGLIYGMILGTFFEVILSFLIIRPTPKFVFNPALFRKVIGYGKWITASTIFNYFYQHGDNIVVGRILGSTSLGLYDMAYRISLAPLTDISDVVSKVTFPVYMKFSEDKQRLKKAFLKTLGFVFLFTLPIGLVLFIFPKEIISIVLGEKWLLAVPVLKILGIFGVVRAVSSFSQNIFLSLGKQNIFTLISLVGFGGLAISIIPFVTMWGITGAALSALVGTSLTIPVIFYYIRKFLW
ncbi:MAG: oligosaccharide flippase family protein, partial [Patescibacteria group bacterium]